MFNDKEGAPAVISRALSWLLGVFLFLLLLSSLLFVRPWYLSNQYVERAQSAYKNRQSEEVIVLADKALTYRSNNAAAYDVRGDALVSIYRRKEAMTAYQKAVDFGTTRVFTYLTYSTLLSFYGQSEKAMEVLKLALERSNVASSPDDRAQLLAGEGQLAQSGGDYQSAEKYYLDAHNLAPNNPSFLNALGVVLSRQGKNDEALANFEQSLKIAPSAITYVNIASIYIKEGQTNRAIETAEKGRELDEKEPTVYEMLGYSYRQSGRTDEAKAAFTKYLELAPQWMKDVNPQNITDIKEFLGVSG